MANLGYILKETVMTATSGMNDSEFRETITGLFNYAIKGVVPEFNDPLQKAIFLIEKPAIDYNVARWECKRKEMEARNNDPDRKPF